MYVDRERARERDKLHKKCVSEREKRPRRGGREMEGEKRMSWHRIFAYVGAERSSLAECGCSPGSRRSATMTLRRRVAAVRELPDMMSAKFWVF